jgi:hypothetical protein
MKSFVKWFSIVWWLLYVTSLVCFVLLAVPTPPLAATVIIYSQMFFSGWVAGLATYEVIKAYITKYPSKSWWLTNIIGALIIFVGTYSLMIRFTTMIFGWK